jgi:hypothetical protein
MTDKRRYGVIELHQVNAETYHLKIGGELWSEVQWSRSRKTWCIQDCCGQCLAHVESIVGQDLDMRTAIRLAKKMIVDGRMPTPEEARAAHDRRRLEEDRQRWDPVEDDRANKKAADASAIPAPTPYLGEPFSMDPDPEPLSVPTKRR